MLRANIDNTTVKVKCISLYSTFTVAASFPISENVRVEMAIARSKAPVAGNTPLSMQVMVVRDQFINYRQ